MTETVGELGEQRVLARILQHLRPGKRVLLGPGDDCAILHTSNETVITTDTMIEGHDFRLDWHTPKELGWKLAATNLSDVASMGATPTALTLAVACPEQTTVRFLEEIAQGMQHACDELAPGCSVAGGDLAQAPILMGAVTALGTLEGIPAVTRDGACPGDTVVYTGELGLAGLGLEALLRDGASARHNAGRAVSAHLTPVPPIQQGATLARAGATSMMDVSDGLSLDAARLGRASGVTVHLQESLLQQYFGQQQGTLVPLRSMLTGGEDHGLLATLPPDHAVPPGVYPIGTVEERTTELLLDGEPFTPAGWDTFVTGG